MSPEAKQRLVKKFGVTWLLLFPCARIDALRRKKANAAALQSVETAGMV